MLIALTMYRARALRCAAKCYIKGNGISERFSFYILCAFKTHALSQITITIVNTVTVNGLYTRASGRVACILLRTRAARGRARTLG